MPPLVEAAPPAAARDHSPHAVHAPVAGMAMGDTLSPGAELPAGHPSMPGMAAGAATGKEPLGEVDPHAALPAGHPHIGGEAMGAGAAGGAGAPEGDNVMPGPGPAFDPKARITGVIAVDGAVKASVSPGDAIFLVARVDDGTEKGTILGVKRFSAGAFPLAFEIDGRDSMFAGTKFAGKVLLSARVDKDGDAISKNPGDVLGLLHVEVPAEKVRVLLDTITK